jgi:hypothetical protein
MFCVQCGAPGEAGFAACRGCGALYADGSHVGYRQAEPHLSLKLGPTNCRRRDGHVSRNCAITLLGDHIAVSSGTPTTVALSDVVAFRAMDGGYNGEHYSGTKWLVFSIRGQEVGFMMKPAYADAWVQALNGQMPTPR